MVGRKTMAAALAGLLALAAVPLAAKKNRAEACLVEGRVTDLEGEPVAGVRVTITHPDRPDFEVVERTDREGEFKARVEGIEEGGGDYVFLLEKEGFDPFETLLEMAPGMTQEVTFKLAPEGMGQAQQARIATNAGAQAYQTKDMETAKAKFLEAVELDPELPQPHLYLADIYYGEERYEEAAAELEVYRAHESDDEQAIHLAFEIYRALDDEDRVEQALAELQGSERAKQIAARVYNEGVAANRNGDVERALADFGLARRLDPELATIYSGMAAVLYNQRRYHEALEAVEELLAREPESVQGRRLRFLILDGLGQAEAAAEALAAYGEVAPEGAAAVLYEKAEMDFRAGRTDTAKAALLQVIQIQPDLARAHLTLGLCYASTSENAKAREHLERFIELAPDDPEVATAREMLEYL